MGPMASLGALGGTETVVVVPLWVLIAGLAALGLVAWLACWANAWLAVRFVQRGGRFATPARERLETLRAEKELERERQDGSETELTEADEGRVVE